MTKSNRVSLTCTEVQINQLVELAEVYGTHPTTLAHQVVSERIRDAIDKGVIDPTNSTKHKLATLTRFIQLLAKEEGVDKETIEDVSSISGVSVEKLNETFFWEPENEQEL